MQLPSVGRIVHYYPGPNDQLHPHFGNQYNNNGCDHLPAMIVQVFGTTCANLVVFCFNTDATLVRRYSAQHKSAAGEGGSYWEWPQVLHEAKVVEMPIPQGNYIPPIPGTTITMSSPDADLRYKGFPEDNGNQPRA